MRALDVSLATPLIIILQFSVMDSSSSCCACSSALVVGNRRGVNNSEVVSKSWKNLMEDIGKNLNVFGESELWMCKKCFSSYQRFGALRKTLVDALLHVEPENLSSAPKRPRVHPPAHFQAQACSSSASPDVAVSNQ